MRVDLRAALFSALQSQQPANALFVRTLVNGEARVVDIHVSPALDLAPNHLLVRFEESVRSGAGDNSAHDVQDEQRRTIADQLERELDATRAQLKDIVEQSETSTEELRASNEELQAVNEELRSATEELETSREELQSINEELTTVNFELKGKVDELSQANSDLQVLMSSTAIATLFLDLDLRIMRYTPAAVELFNLISTDVGRPLTDLTNRLNYPEMVRDARRAIGELVTAEREVQAGGRWYIARTVPYRSADERIGGVVFTFVDITARRQAEDALRELQAEQAEDLVALLRLQELNSRLLTAAELAPQLKQLLDATVEMQRADFGNIQLYDAKSRTLEIVAQRGFDAAFVEHFKIVSVDDTASACGRAFRNHERVTIVDVQQDRSYAPLREVAEGAGYRAVQSSPLFDRNDQPLGILTTHFRDPHQPSPRQNRLTDLYARQAADVIGSKLAEQRLRESGERFRAMVEQTALGVAEINFSGLVTFANPRLCEIVGRSPEELNAVRMQDITHPDDLAIAEAAFKRLQRDGTAYDLEQRLLCPDGRSVPVSVNVAVVRDRYSHPVAATALVLDLTERNRAQAASRESEERLRLVVENAREYAIFAMDLERRVTSWYSGAQRLLGYSEAEIIGQPGDIIFTPEDRAAGAPEQEARTALATGRASDERWHVRRDGSRFWGSGVMMAMQDGNKKTIGLIKIFRDQTEAREITEALAQSRVELMQALQDNKIAREELESASRAKDRFLAVLSHELRTPLTPVVMAVQTLMRRADLPAPERDALEMIRRNIKIESHLIDDLLDLTRITRGRLEVVTEPMDLHAAVSGAVEVCASDIHGKIQTLQVSLEATRHQTEGEPNRLQQVVWNLLKNASKFTRRGGEIRLSTRNEENRFVLTVSDSGIGIHPNALPTIFDAFSQGGEWVAREYGGLGLGLAIAKATVEAHGGTIKAASGGPNQGSTFTVELPLIERQ
ncbi:MAG: PAS domain S-box protein [Burkholderiaceae bacterium]